MGSLDLIQEYVGPPKTRGRKMNISKARIKEKLEIVDGKKIPLKGSLRVAMTLVVGSK